MAIVTGELWESGDRSTFYVSCVSCGKYLDRIESDDISRYIDYVHRTQDSAFCQECDTSQDDIIHPFVDKYARDVLRDPACLVTHNFTDVIEDEK